jgi:hypothetical protein
MTTKVFLEYFGVDGLEGVQDKELEDYFVEHFGRYNMLAVNLSNPAGEDLEGDGLKAAKKRTDDYYDRLQDGVHINTLISEENSIRQSIMDAAETEDDDHEEESTATATETPAETGTVATATETTKATETTAETSTNTSTGTGTAEDNSDETSEETTDEYDPYEYEFTLWKVIPDEGQDPDDIDDSAYSDSYYSRKLHNAVFDTKIGEYVKFEDETLKAMFIIQRLDTRERMTEEDLWTEDNKNAVVYKKFYADFEKLLETWSKKLTVVRNESAYKRYDPFTFQF